MYALIDLIDVKRVESQRWKIASELNNFRVSTNIYKDGKKTTISLSRFLLQPLLEMSKIFNPKKNMISFLDNNVLNNKRNNLIFVSKKGLAQRVNSLWITNTSGIRGVYWKKEKNKWRVQIMHNNKSIFGGCFDNIEDAAQKRKELEEQYLGKVL